MSNSFNYKSILAKEINRLIEIKRSMGFNVLQYRYMLKEIDDYVHSQNLETPIISRELIDGWLKTRINDSPRTLYAKYTVWAQVARNMRRNGYVCYIPKLPPLPKVDFIPYIYTHEQVSRLFEECDNLVVVNKKKNVGLFCMPILYRLLYSTGLRISEALSIRNEDINIEQKYIIIRKSKNGAERIVPICESLFLALKQYESYRNRIPIEGIKLPKYLYFIKLDGTAISSGSVLLCFHRLLKMCGIPYKGSHHGPRVHDLRHTFAVHALAQMGHNKIDIYAGLPILSTCLGHKSPASTELYVRLTYTMFPEIEEQCSQINTQIFPK